MGESKELGRFPIKQDIYPEICPSCTSDLRDPKHFEYLLIISVYSQELDRTVAWKCPYCLYEWDRE